MTIRTIVRISISLVVLIFFLLHSANIFRVSFLNSMENIAYDMRLNWTLPNTIDDRIVIADIDEKSLAEIGRWPWGRNKLADMIEILFEHYRINVIGFDIVFAEKDESSGLKVLDKLAIERLYDNMEYLDAVEEIRQDLENDRLFSESLYGRNVILGHIFNSHDEVQFNNLPTPIGALGKKQQNKIPIIEAKGFTGNLDILTKNAKAGGFFDNPRVDEDGVFRRVPILQQYNDNLYESLALSIARHALNNPEMRLNITDSDEYYAIESISLGDENIIPVDEEANVIVPYRGEQGSFPYISISDILNKRTPRESLEGKIVLVGTSAPGLLDLRSTPVGKAFAGVEVHANIVSGILDNRIKHQPAFIYGYDVIVTVLIGILMITLLAMLSPLMTSIFTVGLIVIAIGTNLLAWDKGLVLPIASQVLLIISLFVLQMSYGFFVESRGKRALAKLFGQYIPPELVEEMSEDPKDIMLEGQSREMTVLFTDVRGFTTISEGLDPKALAQLMNSFLTPMTRVIHTHRGTIDKYMGDAIMAFWGAPLDDQYHAKNALLASMDMVQHLKELQNEFKAKGWPEIKVGVGLNTGNMSVGNMGSEFRMAYTVMGDAVNLGSRLEGLTKQYGVSIIVSEFTKQAVPEFEFLELDRVRVKGKDEPVTIYEPLGMSVELTKEEKSESRRFNKALKLYRSQQWDIAEQEIFSLSQSRTTKDRIIYQIYLDRIMYYRSNQPPSGWDGVFTHTTK